MTTRQPPSPLHRAVGLLSRREHSRRELRQKLIQRGVEADEAEAAIERLGESGLQDDGRFAQSLIRQRSAAGYGPRYIEAELATHHIGDAEAAAALEELAPDWTEIAADLLQRRFPAGLDDPRARRRAQALLIRRGFDGECIRAAMARCG